MRYLKGYLMLYLRIYVTGLARLSKAWLLLSNLALKNTGPGNALISAGAFALISADI